VPADACPIGCPSPARPVSVPALPVVTGTPRPRFHAPADSRDLCSSWGPALYETGTLTERDHGSEAHSYIRYKEKST